MDCQLVIVNDKSHQILSPVNIMQSNFSMLLPTSEDKFLVTARAVDIHGDTIDSEMLNVNFDIATMITPSAKPTISSTSGGKEIAKLAACIFIHIYRYAYIAIQQEGLIIIIL